MSKQNIFTELRNARVERILDSKQNRVLTSPWMRRLLSLVAIVSSYVMMATLLIPTPYWISKNNRVYAASELIEKSWIYDARDTTQGITIFLLIWSFILLRISMRRVTLLPDQYLDELQITNRDWAFKTGYLVVRRIGFGVLILFAFLATVGNQMTRTLAGYSAGPKFFRALERYISDLSMEDPFGFYFKAFLLLTFVAYSFPLILLAWREARFPESIPEMNVTKELNIKQSNAKFYFAALRWIVLSISLYVSIFVSPKMFMGAGGFLYIPLIFLMYLVVPGAILLYIWASVTVGRDLLEARKAPGSSLDQKRWTNITTAFFSVTQLLGLLVGSLIFSLFNRDGIGQPWFLPTAVIAGLLMIPAQAITMTFYAKLESK